jgi:hypothetical protein
MPLTVHGNAFRLHKGPDGRADIAEAGQVLSRLVEYLHAEIKRIHDIEIAGPVDGNVGRVVELAVPRAPLTAF